MIPVPCLSECMHRVEGIWPWCKPVWFSPQSCRMEQKPRLSDTLLGQPCVRVAFHCPALSEDALGPCQPWRHSSGCAAACSGDALPAPGGVAASCSVPLGLSATWWCCSLVQLREPLTCAELCARHGSRHHPAWTQALLEVSASSLPFSSSFQADRWQTLEVVLCCWGLVPGSQCSTPWVEAAVPALICTARFHPEGEGGMQTGRRGCCSFKASKGLQPFRINCSQNPCHNSLYGAAFFLRVAMTTAALHHSSALVLGCIASPSAYSKMFRGASGNHWLRCSAPLFTYPFSNLL